jgi:hypothetical protein
MTYTVFLASSNSNSKVQEPSACLIANTCIAACLLHLDPLLPWSRTLEVLLRGLNVVVNSFLRQINHVGAEQWFAVLLVVSLVGVHHA